MALSPKLELRQGQQLVMTPQLQQAIRLLQLSNIELDAVRRERARAQSAARSATTAPKPPVRAEIETSRFRQAAKRRRQPARRTGVDLDKPVADPRRHARHRIRQRLSRYGAAPDHANGQRRLRLGLAAPARRRLRRRRQPRGLRRQRRLAARPLDRAAAAGAQGPGRAADRPASHRHGRRGRLPAGADLDALAAKLGAPQRAGRAACSATLQTLDPPGVFARSLAECLALQLKEQNRYDPQIASRCSTTCTCSAATISPALQARRSASRWTSCRDDRRDQAAQSQAGPQVRLRADAARGARRSGARRRPTAAGSSSSTPTRCRACWSTAATSRPSRRRRGSEQDTRLSARVPADRQLAGQEPRPAGAHHPARRRGDRAPAGRLLHARRPAPAAAQPEARSPTPSRCTNRPCRASPPTSTWRRRAASSSSSTSSPPPSPRPTTRARRIPPRPCATASSS